MAPILGEISFFLGVVQVAFQMLVFFHSCFCNCFAVTSLLHQHSTFESLVVKPVFAAGERTCATRSRCSIACPYKGTNSDYLLYYLRIFSLLFKQ
jgi:hypothetical protein